MLVDVKGLNGRYKIDTDGNVFSVRRNDTRLLRPRIGHKGYVRYVLYRNAIPYNVNIQRLVWEHFKGEIPKGFEINHIDGNKRNNSISNLEVVTPSQNMRHAVKMGLTKHKISYNHHQAKKVGQYTLSGILVKEWGCMKDIERETGFFQPNISACCTGKADTYKQFIWKFI